MDTLISLLVKAILELFPELLKRDGRPLEEAKPVLPSKAEVAKEIPITVEAQPTTLVTKAHSTLRRSEEQPIVQGNIDQNTIINGIIFSEILQPPRAYRPFVRRLK